jgi:hypothetical protein
MKKEHLHLLIHEEIYLLPDDKAPIDDDAIPVEGATEKTDTSPIHQEIISEKDKPAQESPTVPSIEPLEPEQLPFAIFHDSTEKNEIDLLEKIIAACNLPEHGYKIFGKGFDQSVKFKKALVFVPKAKAFYTPIPYKGSEFLCSKPLSELLSNKQEKAKLWNALQRFVLA